MATLVSMELTGCLWKQLRLFLHFYWDDISLLKNNDPERVAENSQSPYDGGDMGFHRSTASGRWSASAIRRQRVFTPEKWPWCSFIFRTSVRVIYCFSGKSLFVAGRQCNSQLQLLSEYSTSSRNMIVIVYSTFRTVLKLVRAQVLCKCGPLTDL